MKNTSIFTLTGALWLGISLISAWSSAGAERTVQINGVSGEVYQPLAQPAKPGDRVAVKVCPADLINYEYEIQKSEEQLKESYSIVGVGTVFEGVSGGGTVAVGGTDNLNAAEASLNNESKDLLQKFRSLRKDIGDQRQGVVNDVAGVVDASSVPLFDVRANACDAWPAKISSVAGDGTTEPSFLAIYRARTEKLEGLEKRRQVLLTEIRDLQLSNLAAGKPASSDFVDALKQDAEALQGAIASLQSTLDKARDLASRWAKIISHHPKPVLSQTFLMPQTSTRITVGVNRKPITAEARMELTETDPTKIQPQFIASTSFESHSPHRFNISTGLVGIGRSDIRDMEVVSSLNSAGTTVYHVRETKQDNFEYEGAAFLGIYFKEQDNFDLTRKPAWMVMIGSELSTSPTDYFLGLGVDWKQGVVLGLGITEYESISPADGWRIGQEIPPISSGNDAGKPQIATVPKEKKDAIGAYFFIGFRPSIFRAFLDRRKPG